MLISSVLILIAAGILVHSFMHLDSPVSADSHGGLVEKEELEVRLVFVVIDAFRLSFLTNSNSPMRFIRDCVETRRAVLFNAYARMPTVTLPRITAYLSGTLPSFGTILTNLATSEMRIDNWVSRIRANQGRIDFFGDDTWIRLLPEQFTEYEGVHSFFVNDYTEVDDNVTRNLEREIEDRRWDALVLHYLGLDHIGHSLGGNSPKIREKLIEMDGIVKRIVKGLKDNSKKTYVIVCGDHGMTPSGSHGGSSLDETRVPVIFWDLSDSKISAKREGIIAERLQKIEQIDVSATIFEMFGLDPPKESYGISFLGKSIEKQWRHFTQLADSRNIEVKLRCGLEDPCDFSKEFIRNEIREESKRIQGLLIEESSNIPNIQLGISISILILAFFLVFQVRHSRFQIFLFFTTSTYFASSFIEEEHELWYYLTSIFLAIRLIKTYMAKEKDTWRNIFILLFLHRISIGWMQSTRRRWAMDADLLPECLFRDPFSIEVDDMGQIMSKYPYFSLSVSIISWILWFISKNQFEYFPILAFISHFLRISNFVRFDAYFLIAVRLTLLLSFRNSWSIVSFILILIPTSQLLLLFITFLIGYFSSKIDLDEPTSVIMLMSSFFYTGNSNSISTLSLTSAYIGLLDYYPVFVGIQLFFNTYAGPIVFMSGRSVNKSNRDILSCFHTFRIACLVMSLSCLYIFQNHLFVWSVYTPKAVYDLFHSLFSVIVFFSLNLNKIRVIYLVYLDLVTKYIYIKVSKIL